MAKPFDNLRDKMSEDQRYMADQLAEIQLASIARDKMLADMEEEVRTAMLRVQDAVIILRDYDGHYDRETETGDSTELANLIDEVVRILTSRNYVPDITDVIFKDDETITMEEMCSRVYGDETTQEPEMMEKAKKLVEKIEALDALSELSEAQGYEDTHNPLIKDKEAERNRIANGIMASESFMWLMVGANHPESHCANLRNAFKAWRDNGGKSWGKI